MPKLYEVKGFKRYKYDPINQVFISNDRNVQNAHLGNTIVRFKKGQEIKVITRNNRKGSALLRDGSISKSATFVYFDKLVEIGNVYEIVKGA